MDGLVGFAIWLFASESEQGLLLGMLVLGFAGVFLFQARSAFRRYRRGHVL